MAALKNWLFGSKPQNLGDVNDDVDNDGEVPTPVTTAAEPEKERKETAEDNETPISAPLARKRARFIYATGEEEDEISGDVGSSLKSAKRARVAAGRRPKDRSIKPKTTPPTPTSMQLQKEVTPRRRAKKIESSMMTPQSMDYAEDERTVRESIEKDLDGDLGKGRLSLDSESQKAPAFVQHDKVDDDVAHHQEQPASDGQDTNYPYFTGEQGSTSGLSPSTAPGYDNCATNSDIYSDNTSSSSENSESEEGSVKPLRIEQKLLNIILEARDEFTLMPSTWAMHFRGYPVPPSIFYTKVKDVSSRPRIYARTDKLEYNGTRVFLKIADIHSRIRDHRYSAVRDFKDRTKPKGQRRASRAAHGREIVKKLRPVLEEAMEWSRHDGDLVKFGDSLPPNMEILEVKNADSKRATKEEIRSKMLALAQTWQNRMAELEDKVKNGELDTLPEPPVIYALVIIEHQVLLVHMDASDITSEHHIRARLIMTAKNYQVWNALAIMVTICWARDKLMEIAKEMKLQAVKQDTDSDPDA